MAETSNQKLRCTIIGAGVSGLLMAYKLRKHLGDYVDFTIYEKNLQLGGTWHENRYPGCACDVPSHVYQYSFAPNPDWSKFYASSHEIQSYLARVAQHFDLERHIRFGREVSSAKWSEVNGTWTVDVSDGTTIESEILVNAGGILNHPQLPNIEGWSSFEGQLLHTADWDPETNLEGKRVAVIGAGASAVQLVPELQTQCEQVQVHIRTPSWIVPPVALDIPDATNYTYTEQEKRRFRSQPGSYLETRKNLEGPLNSMFRAFFKTSPEQADIRAKLTERMKMLISDEELQKHLIPDFEVGCRRVSPGEKFLAALQKPNVQPIFDTIEKVTPAGVVSGGVERPLDALIAATGFNTSFKPRFPVIGRKGVNLQDVWSEDPVSYMGTGVHGFPNYLIFLGPNTPISNGSLMGPLEATSDYFIRLLRKMIRQRVRSVEVRAEAQQDFDRHTGEYMQDMVWTGSCRSWFKKGIDGKVTALWPGSGVHYMQTLAEDRWEDYEWKYSRERYAYWGDGTSWVEEPAADPLGLDQREALEETTTVPKKGSGPNYYLWQSTPIPEVEGPMRDSCLPSPEEKAVPEWHGAGIIPPVGL